MAERIVICRSNPVDPDPRVEKTAHTLVQAGYAVSIVAWNRAGQPIAHANLPDIEVERLGIHGKYGSGMQNLGPLLRWQWLLLGWLWQHRGAYRAIHACDFDTILPAMLMKLLAGKIVVYDIFDFYTDHVRLRSGWMRSALRWLDHHMIRAADAVILVDDARTAQLAGTHPRRLEIIYNTPQDEPELPINLRDESKTGLRIAYIGLLQLDRGLQYLIELLPRHPDWHFDLAGFGGDEAAILQDALTLPNLTWHKRVPYRKALEISAQSDVLLATYDPSIPNNRLASPNKVFEAMMLSKPVIVAEGTGIDALVVEHQTGIAVPYGNIKKLETALEQLVQNPTLCQILGANGRRLYKQRYDWDEMRARLTILYHKRTEYTTTLKVENAKNSDCRQHRLVPL